MTRGMLLGAVLVTALLAALPVYGQAQSKKLVEFGWDFLSPSGLAANIDKMRASPFDGLVIGTNYTYTFYLKGQTEAGVKGDIAKLKAVNWGHLTDNFLYLCAGSNVDWFDDKAWAPNGNLLKNAGFCGQLAKEAGFVGFYLEPEFVYWGQPLGPWDYSKQPRAKDKTYAEMAAMAQKRGVQFMQAIEKQFPHPVVLMSFGPSLYETVYLAKLPINDSKARADAIEKSGYGLLVPFLAGMLEGSSPETTFIDGNENNSYYYSSPLDYCKSYKMIHQTCQELFPPELRAKYRAQYQCGQAIWADYLLGTSDVAEPATFLTAQERIKWVEHNVYWALTSCDHYAWFYDERPNWKNGANIPPEMPSAIAEAREKVANGENLGFSVEDAVARADKACKGAYSAPLHLSKAQVPMTDTAPRIGNGLSDPAWSKAATLGPFVANATARRKELFGTTEARVMYDDQCLYVAVDCHDPQMKDLVTSKLEDVQFWAGDEVELAIAATPAKEKYYHLKINPANETWCSLTKAGFDIFGKNKSWPGDFRSAVEKGANGWTVEVAIKWASMDMQPPEPGTRLQGNIIRRTRRWPDSISEYSSWSESRAYRCPEAAAFGTWTFE